MFLLGVGTSAQQGGEGGGSAYSLIMIALIGVVFYFLLIRPQSKRQKEQKKMISSVEKGDSVTTIGGIRGTVQSVKEDTFLLQVDGSTKIEFSRNAISNVTKSKAKDDQKKVSEEDSQDNKKTKKS